MIVNHKYKFVFIKFPKSAGTSLEFFLTQFCNAGDLITPLRRKENEIKKKFNLRSHNNYIYYKTSFRLKYILKNFLNALKFKKINFKKKFRFSDHSTLDDLDKYYPIKLHDYLKFCVIRNPYELIISYFFWELVSEKNVVLKKSTTTQKINKMNLKELKSKFNLYLENNCFKKFSEVRKLMYGKDNKIKIDQFLKYENLKQDLNDLIIQLNIDDKKIYSLDNFNLKSYKINKDKNKLISKKNAEAIKQEAMFLFKIGNYSKIVPKTLRA